MDPLFCGAEIAHVREGLLLNEALTKEDVSFYYTKMIIRTVNSDISK